MMRFAVLFLCAFALPGLAGGGAAWAQRTQDPPAAAGGGPEEVKPPKLSELPLDELFEKLAASSPNPAGKAVENEILNRFAKSGSDTTDLLMRWAMEAIEEKNYAMALDILDQVLVLKPDFAEAWNKRATVNFLREDHASSLSDIRQTLALEPRHFGALSGLGIILEQTGKKEEALAVFRKALAIDPLLEKVRETLERLEVETAGSSI
jgi:tetratricopeptide (TPR) repeat protein